MAAHGQRLQQTLAEVRRLLYPVALFSICFNITLLTIPIYMLQVYDRVLTSRNPTTLLMLTLVAVGLIAAGAALHHYRTQTVMRLGNYVQQQLGDPVVAAMFRSRVANQDKNYANDLDRISDFMSGNGLVSLFDIPWGFVFIGVVFLLHAWLGVAATIAALILLLIGIMRERHRAERSLEAVRAKALGDQFLGQSLSHAEIVKAMGMGQAMGREWRRRRRDAAFLMVQAADSSSRATALKNFVRQLAQMTMLGLGAYLAIQDVVSAGTIVAASIICSRALAPLDQVIPTWRGFCAAREAYRSLRGAIDDPKDATDDRRAPIRRAALGSLRVEDTSVVLTEGQPAALESVTFALQPGDSLGVIGPSGSGKSLLARLLVGACPATSGRVLLDGVDLRHIDETELGAQIGYLPQRTVLFDGSLADNIARFGDVHSDLVIRAAELADVHEAIVALPEGYHTQVAIARNHLSPSQMRSLSLARALYREPALVVLDNDDARLDEAGHRTMHRVIQSCREQRQTLVMISDRPSVVRALDWLALLVDGRFEGMVRPEKLLAGLGLLKGPVVAQTARATVS